MTQWDAVLRAVAPRADAGFVRAFDAIADRLFSVYGVTSASAQAIIIGECAHETQGFTHFEEGLAYTAKRLTQVWPTRFPSLEAAKPFERNPRALANRVYNGRMGNRVGSDDGWNYRGSGAMQHTGRSEFERVGRRTGQPVVDIPGMLRDPAHAEAMIAGAITYVIDRRLLAAASAGQVDAVSRGINGGDLGLADRRILCNRALTAMRGAPQQKTEATTVERRDRAQAGAKAAGAGAASSGAAGAAVETKTATQAPTPTPQSATGIPAGAAIALGIALAAGFALVAWRLYARANAHDNAVVADRLQTIEARAASAQGV